MSSQLNPYVCFQGNARQAMEFYKSALGGELAIVTMGDYGNENEPDLIMHARLDTPSGFTLMASDLPEGAPFTAGSQIALSLTGTDEEEMRGFWDALNDDAAIEVPLEKQMWGDTFGQLVDKFGINWMVDIAQGE
jgi:PhnB protein